MMPLMDRWKDYDHLAFEERCYEYDNAECYQNNNIEEQGDNESNQNPQRRKRKRKAHKKAALGNKVQRNYINGRLNNMDMHSRSHQSGGRLYSSGLSASFCSV